MQVALVPLGVSREIQESLRRQLITSVLDLSKDRLNHYLAVPTSYPSAETVIFRLLKLGEIYSAHSECYLFCAVNEAKVKREKC